MIRLRLTAVFLPVAAAFALATRPAQSAVGDTAYLFGLDSTLFPQISVYLSVSNALGNRLAGLTADQIALREDDSPARQTVLTEEQTGVRLVVVVDPGLDLIYALPSGEKRIERLQRAMADWLGTLPQSGIDDLTLITPEGTAVSHSSDPEAFLAGLRAYAPKFPADRTLDAMLVDALGAAADPAPRRGMRAMLVVFSASKLSQAEDIGRGLCPRALELHAPLYGIWSGRTEPSAKTDMESLAALASECGGYSVALESATGTAALLATIATQRTQYRLDYRSAALTSGEHALTAAVTGADFQAETEPLRFQLEIQPPEVHWIDFPGRLTRKGSEISQPVETYLPEAVELRVEVTFPDGHPREIVSLQLFADSELVEGECVGDPCAGIRWDLRKYTASAKVRLQMVVRDELGLEGKTEERDFNVTVERPTVWEIFRAYYLLPVAIILAAASAVGILIAAMVNLNRVRAAQAADEMIFPDAGSAAAIPAAPWKQRVGRLVRRKRAPAEPPAETYAVLEELGDSGRRFEIAAADVIVGRDPKASGIVLDDPSVSPRHGRIVRMGDGIPWLFDLGSTAGSWKNFEEIPPDGAALREGDRLNFGRIAFRVRILPCAPAKETIHET